MAATPRFDSTTLGLKLWPRGPGPSFQLPAPPPILIGQGHDGRVLANPRRTRIWELSKHLHCSIIGTCLSTGELRQILNKAKLVRGNACVHELHSEGVLLAGQRDGAAKLLHKALDKRHRLA